MVIVGARCFDRVCPEERGDEFIGDERVFGDDDLIAGSKKRMAEKLNYFVGSVAKNNIGARETEMSGKSVAQIKSPTVWIKLCVL